MRGVFLPCLALMIASGCQKQSAPEFYKLESQATILIDGEGDDAWLSAQMEELAAGLQKIPPDAIEGPRAAALLARINAERGRLLALRAKPREVSAVGSPSPSFPSPAAAVASAEPAEPIDAGPASEPMPTPGMPEVDFVKLFGACFTKGAPLTLQGKQATSQVVTNSTSCVKRFGGGEGQVSYLFADGKFAGTRTTVRQTTQLPPLPPKPVEPVDAGEPRLFYPGQPLQ